MSCTQQRGTVVQALLDEPYRFEFFQAVRLMVEWLGQSGIAPERALTEHVLFENVLSFSFAPAQIAEVGADEETLEVRFTPAFMGFLGVNGTLPFHYTERIYAYESTTHDEAPRAFLDMFSNRALALFYMAWCKHRVEHLGAEDGFLSLLLNFAGFQRGAGTLDDAVIARYAGVLVQRPVPPDVLASVLADYLRVPLVIDETTGCWMTLNRPEQCALGLQNAVLSTNAMLGERSWRPDLRAEIRIGPLSRQQFDASLPGGDSARVLAQLLRIFGNPTVSYDVRLILKAAEINPMQLSGGAAQSARLGQDSFLVSQTEDLDRSDMTYRITLLEPLPPLPHFGQTS
jgi:type VI secretion system protein ImpH